MRGVEADRHEQRPDLRLEEPVDPAPLRLVAIGMVDDADAVARASAGITSSLKTVYCSSTRACAAAASASRSRAETPVPGRRAASRLSAKRTSKNSSRFEETMQT